MMQRINPNTPNLTSWLNVAADSDFPIQNLPFGIFSKSDDDFRVASRIGDDVIDLAELFDMGLLNGMGLEAASVHNKVLNDFIAQGKKVTNAVRARLAHLMQSSDPEDLAGRKDRFVYRIEDVDIHLPLHIGDYTDFYSSEDHARNVGTMFRDPDNALLPNWKHLPVGYHGRASSIVVSGTPVRRPMGQTIPADSKNPVYGASKLLDFELEVGFVVGKNNELGNQVSTAEADEYIFGVVLFNDWSARDIQKWEYVPLGPFLAKSFASTMSPWVVTLEALEPFRVPGPKQEPHVLPYLEYEGKWNFDINLSVSIETPAGDSVDVCKSNFRYMYWNMAQQLAHHTVNGCNVQVGDVCASGTISGPEEGSYGSMLEITWRGTKPVQMPDGSQRKFINDGDDVVLRGSGTRDGVRIGFGECRGKVLPALG